jgi:hypothetical protein
LVFKNNGSGKARASKIMVAEECKTNASGRKRRESLSPRVDETEREEKKN